MKHTMRKLVIGVFTMLLALSAVAQEDELRTMPGYVAFESLDEVYGEPKVRVNVGGFLLSLMSKAAKNDPEAAAVLEGLEGVRINVYSTGGEVAPAIDQLQNAKNMLSNQNWEPIVPVNEDGQNVQVFIKANGEGVQGLTVMAVDADDAVFVNILGSIDPENLGAIMDQFDVDLL
ncbi:MAG: DUF4252 domain-containing protein [Proteobacteria bacterium]|nr:DUF4252 domain-containing protein [Pseudomonadota bacterium]